MPAGNTKPPGLRAGPLRALVVLATLTLLIPAVARAEPPPALFGLAVGYNLSPNKRLPRLKYADDDAIRNFLLLRTLGAQAV